jgi:hypothetical protein
MWKRVTAATVALVAGVAAATSEPSSPPGADEGLEPVATIQDIMKTLVDPSADALWASVASTTTASGTENREPKTEDEWNEVRRYAISLAEAPNLLLTPGRQTAIRSNSRRVSILVMEFEGSAGANRRRRVFSGASGAFPRRQAICLDQAVRRGRRRCRRNPTRGIEGPFVRAVRTG